METYFLKPEPVTQTSSTIDDNRRPLLILNGFRSLIALIFSGLYLTDNLVPPLGDYNPELFFQYSLIYLLLSLSLWVIHYSGKVPLHIQVWASAITDIILLTLLMHVSGGIQSGLGVLIVVTIASTSVIMGGRTALGLAALATLAILVEQAYISLINPINNELN